MQKLLPQPSFGLVIFTVILGFCNAQKPQSGPAGSASVAGDSLPYDLQNPSLTINLVSESLKEISGLGPSDTPGYYIAIADERGEVFFIDGERGGAISRRILFREKGDFEGVEMVGKTIWALKSDGDLFEITDWKKGAPVVAEYKTQLKKSDDLEGLAYDPWRKCLLLACKQNPDSTGKRQVWAFNLKSKTLESNPVYSVDPEEVNRLVAYGESEKHDFFSPSAIALHPKTQDVYLISTALKRLVVLDYKSGAIKHVQTLNKKLLPQPEGLAFDADGNLIIGSEGKKGEGLLLKFEYKRNK
ncbi:MAG TPA: SdiA-regulated domain-containing protein [Saprospiraceae bacterium]|nr:SdiA-regulated domain-containing protein [Saprospiraceae bacterium]